MINPAYVADSWVFSSEGRTEVFLLFENMIFCVTGIDLVSTFRLSKLVKVYEQKVCFFVDVPACKIRSALSPSQASSVVHTVGTDSCTLKGSPSVKKNPKTNRTVN